MTRTLTLLALATVLSACATEADPTPDPDHCDIETIELDVDGFYPEGIEHHDGALYVSSATLGQVWRVDACTGAHEEFASSSTPGLSAVGVFADAKRGWLWVAFGDFYTGASPTIEAFDMETGARVASHPLEGGFGMANDLFVDETGDVYVTESFTSSVFRLDGDDAGRDAPVARWSTPAEAGVEAGQLGLNGIWGTRDTLYVAHTHQGALYAIEKSGGGARALELARGLAGPDGVEPLADGRLLVVEQYGASTSAVDVRSGEVEVWSSEMNVPTTAARVGEFVWVVESQFDHLLGIDPSAPDAFRIVRIEAR